MGLGNTQSFKSEDLNTFSAKSPNKPNETDNAAYLELFMASEQGSGTELEEVEMTICGIEMSGSEARLVLLNGDKLVFSHVNVKPKKLKLADDENPDEVKAFRDSIFAFLRENDVTLVAIKKRGKKGDFSGGPVGFKLEGIIQLYDDCPVKLVAAQTISAKQNKDSPDKPDSLLKYQHVAFETAYCVLQ